MNLDNNKSWFFSVFAFVTLFAGSSFLFIGDSMAEEDRVQFSALSDADIEMILAVKEDMREARK